jgi:uncharacterized protein YvpB
MFETLVGLYISIVALTTRDAFILNRPMIQAWGTPPSVDTDGVVSPAPTQPAQIVPAPKPSKKVILDVSLKHQAYTLSCEAASLQMILAYKGISKTQDELLADIGVSEPYKSYTDAEGMMIWGDPNLGFVGNVKGLFSSADRGMRGATGWGVNKDPIARVAQHYFPNSVALTGYTPDDVLKELDAKNPVIFWHVPDSYGDGAITYKTPAGKLIKFFRNHVAVISGYKIENGEVSFYISDPLYGEYYLRKSTLARRMAKYDGDVVVVR